MTDAADPGARARARVRYHAAMRRVRRLHLYLGLFLSPWVFLYGVTGFLFNHPGAFPDGESRTAGRAEVEGTALDGFPTAPELAGRVVAALNDRAGGAAFRLDARDGARYSRPIVAVASGGGREHSVRFDPETEAAVIRSTAAPARDAAAWPGGARVALADPPRDRLERGVPALLARVGIEAGTVAVRNPPDLICAVEADGRRWRVAYNLQTGTLSARPADDPGARLSTRSFLTRLHLSFTYPARVNARWFWAVAVDAAAFTMVFWGGSGLLMWWQLKATRRLGLAALALGAGAAAALAVAMRSLLAS